MNPKMVTPQEDSCASRTHLDFNIAGCGNRTLTLVGIPYARFNNLEMFYVFHHSGRLGKLWRDILRGKEVGPNGICPLRRS